MAQVAPEAMQTVFYAAAAVVAKRAESDYRLGCGRPGLAYWSSTYVLGLHVWAKGLSPFAHSQIRRVLKKQSAERVLPGRTCLTTHIDEICSGFCEKRRAGQVKLSERV